MFDTNVSSELDGYVVAEPYIVDCAASTDDYTDDIAPWKGTMKVYQRDGVIRLRMIPMSVDTEHWMSDDTNM